MLHEYSVENRGFKDINPLILGREKCLPGHSFGPNIRSYYLLHYVVNGKGKLYHNGEEFDIEKDDIFIIKPGEINTYTADQGDPWHYLWVGFDGQIANFFDKFERPVIHCPNTLFMEMLDSKNYTNAKEEYIAGKVLLLISLLMQGEKPRYDYVKKATDYINSSFINPIKICDISRIIGIDRTYLSKIFKKATGKSMQQYLVDTRLQHAKMLLKKGFSVYESATMSGYPDTVNFSKMFKKKYGISPGKAKTL